MHLLSLPGVFPPPIYSCVFVWSYNVALQCGDGLAFSAALTVTTKSIWLSWLRVCWNQLPALLQEGGVSMCVRACVCMRVNVLPKSIHKRSHSACIVCSFHKRSGLHSGAIFEWNSFLQIKTGICSLFPGTKTSSIPVVFIRRRFLLQHKILKIFLVQSICWPHSKNTRASVFLV